MAHRQVTQTRKLDGNITALCNPEQDWSPRSSAKAIEDIEGNVHSYYVLWSDNRETAIKVVIGPNGKYLRTDRDNTNRNNLDDLPNC